MRRGPAAEWATAAVVLIGAALAGCRADTVRISYRPRTGAHYRYLIDVETTTETRLGDRPPSSAVHRQRLVVDQTVLGLTATGTDLRVVLHHGQDAEALRVRYDRAGHLAAIQREDNLPVSSLGQLGPAEVFPASVDAPPLKALRAGDSWGIDAPLELAPSAAVVTGVRVTGHGHLVRLSTRRGRSVAVIHTVLSVPVEGRYPIGAESGVVTLRGVETTEATATRTISDGVVEEESSESRATFNLSAAPPPGVTGSPVPGIVAVMVHATTTLMTASG